MKWLVIVSVLIFFHNCLICHLCHDPFRPSERLILLPEKELIRIEDKGEFRIYVENTFHSTLRDFRLVVESEAFEIDVKPKVLEKLVPGERTFFLIKLDFKEGFEPGEYPLKISVEATEAEIRPSIEKIDIMAEKRPVKPIPQIKPLESIQEITPKEKPGVPIEMIEPKIPVKEIKPEVPIKEAKPEEVRQETEEIVVRVEKIPFWKSPYFYIILILVLVAILVWRKLR